jgi:hypothetical protein
MPFNLLLLPLLGGYWWFRNWNRTRFQLARQDTQRLVIWSAYAGLSLLITSAVLVAVVQLVLGRYAPVVVSWWHVLSPFAHSGKAVGALILGWGAPALLNLVPRWRRPNVWARRATEFYGNETEALLLRAQDSNMPVIATLKTGKVYVGFAAKNINPEIERRHLRLLPVVSGYRAPADQKVTFTTLYEQVRDEAKDPGSPFHSLLDRDFEIVVPLVEITSLGLFDFDAYEAFNRHAPQRGRQKRRRA